METFHTHNPSLEGAMELNFFYHSTPLEMLFLMVSLFGEFGLISFWPKTMDYSKAF